jgi:hypothetical protein
VQSLELLAGLVQLGVELAVDPSDFATVARHVPDVLFWEPTREIETVREALRRIGVFPPNLVVRVSAAMVDGKPSRGFARTSTVVTEGETCPSRDQGGVCGSCRDCWRPDVRNMAYRKH